MACRRHVDGGGLSQFDEGGVLRGVDKRRWGFKDGDELFFLEHPVCKLSIKRIKLILLFELSYMNSNFALTLGDLNPAFNNQALVCAYK